MILSEVTCAFGNVWAYSVYILYIQVSYIVSVVNWRGRLIRVFEIYIFLVEFNKNEEGKSQYKQFIGYCILACED